LYLAKNSFSTLKIGLYNELPKMDPVTQVYLGSFLMDSTYYVVGGAYTIV